MKFLSNSSLFIALMSSMLCIFYTKVVSLDLDLPRIIIVFFGTLLSYIAVQIIPSKNNLIKTNRSIWIDKHKKILYSLMGLSIFIILLFVRKLQNFDLLIFIHLFVLVFFYEKLFITKYELRKVPYLKPFLISYIWAWTCTAPALYYNLNDIDLFIWPECFLFILSLAITFDIRDLEGDKLESIQTIPIKLGFQKAKTLCFFFFIVSLIIQFQFINLSIPTVFISILLVSVYIFLLSKTHPGQKDEYFLFGIDGIMGLKLLYLLVI